MATSRAGAAERVRSFALNLPGAHEEHPWGESVAKVGKKVFVFGLPREDGALALSVKLPASGPDLLLAPFAEPTGYGLGKSGWVTLRFEGRRRAPVEDICRWIEESYRAIAPKTLLRQLDGAPGGAPRGGRPPRSGGVPAARRPPR